MLQRTYPALLPAGRTVQMHAAPGARLVCLEGRLLIRASPQWVGEQMIGQVLSLYEGEVMHMDRGGWLLIEAQRQSAFAVLAPPPGARHPALAALVAAAARLLAGKRRTRAGQAA